MSNGVSLMKLPLVALVACLLSSPVAAYEPDVTQQREEYDPSFPDVDHLIPSGTGLPEEYGPPLHYLARYGRYPSVSAAFEWSLTHDLRHAKAHRYILSSWRLDRTDRHAAPRRVEVKEVEIPQELAAAIYWMWANAILDARYARQGPGVDRTSYWFSTTLRGVGWFSATTWGPQENLPPGWLVEAGEQVLALSRRERSDPAPTLASLRALQARLRKYLCIERNGKANKSIQPTCADARG